MGTSVLMCQSSAGKKAVLQIIQCVDFEKILEIKENKELFFSRQSQTLDTLILNIKPVL